MAHLQCAAVIPGPRFEVFEYMTSPTNLTEQLKGHIEVSWQNPGIELKTGSEFLFLMSRFGVEQPIRFAVDRMILGSQFTYRQVSGVYARFIHTMKFEEQNPNETLVTDWLDYDVPFGLFGRLADDFFVRKDLRKLLEIRLERTREKFARSSENNTDQATAHDGETETPTREQGGKDEYIN